MNSLDLELSNASTVVFYVKNPQQVFMPALDVAVTAYQRVRSHTLSLGFHTQLAGNIEDRE